MFLNPPVKCTQFVTREILEQEFKNDWLVSFLSNCISNYIYFDNFLRSANYKEPEILEAFPRSFFNNSLTFSWALCILKFWYYLLSSFFILKILTIFPSVISLNSAVKCANFAIREILEQEFKNDWIVSFFQITRKNINLRHGVIRTILERYMVQSPSLSDLYVY